MSEWKEYKLVEIINDVAMGPFGSNLKVDNFISSGVPVIRGGNLNNGGFEDKNFVFVSEEKAKSLKRSLAYPDDLVFTHRGTIGQVGIIEKTNYPYYLVSQSQMRLTVNKQFLSPRYLYYWFKSKTGQYELLKNSAQVGVPAIASPTKSLKEIDIKIPDLPTQTAIAQILSSLDDKIELNNKINQELENLAQTLFKQWFIDFEFPNENGEPYKSSGGEMVESEMGEIPKGWDIDKIAKRYEVSDFVANGSFASLKENVNILEEPSYALFLRNTDSKSNFTNQMRYVDEKTYNFLAKSKIIGNEICISNVADVGTVFRPPSYLNKPMTLGNNLVLFRSKSPNYFYYYFKYFYGQYQIQSITSGSAQLKFNKTDFRNLAIIEVPKGILELFENMIGDFTKMQFEILGENVQLTRFRDTLLPKLISGELEVSQTQTTA